MMTQPVPGLGQGIAIFGSIPAHYLLRHVVFERVCNVWLTMLRRRWPGPCLKDRPLKKYEFTHAFSPDPGWGPGSAPAREGWRGRTPGLDQDSRASLSSCCSRHKTSSKILSSRPPSCSFPERRSSSRSSRGPRTSRPSTLLRCATRPVTSRLIPVTAIQGLARARSRSSTVRAGSCVIVVIPSRSLPSTALSWRRPGCSSTASCQPRPSSPGSASS